MRPIALKDLVSVGGKRVRSDAGRRLCRAGRAAALRSAVALESRARCPRHGTRCPQGHTTNQTFGIDDATGSSCRATKGSIAIGTGRGFTLIELLVSVAIMALVLAILLPATGRARLQAKVLAVNAELRDIGLALEMYGLDHEGEYPPVRVDCMLGGHFYQLPCELVQCGYLPAPPAESFLAAGIEDRFKRGYTYKYRAAGTLIYNRTTVMDAGACLWVPDGFPDHEQPQGQTYNDPRESPVRWVLYSEGPRFDLDRMKEQRYPVPRATWYDRKTGRGIVVRMRLSTGREIGSFDYSG